MRTKEREKKRIHTLQWNWTREECKDGSKSDDTIVAHYRKQVISMWILYHLQSALNKDGQQHNTLIRGWMHLTAFKSTGGHTEHSPRGFPQSWLSCPVSLLRKSEVYSFLFCPAGFLQGASLFRFGLLFFALGTCEWLRSYCGAH